MNVYDAEKQLQYTVMLIHNAALPVIQRFQCPNKNRHSVFGDTEKSALVICNVFLKDRK